MRSSHLQMVVRCCKHVCKPYTSYAHPTRSREKIHRSQSEVWLQMVSSRLAAFRPLMEQSWGFLQSDLSGFFTKQKPGLTNPDSGFISSTLFNQQWIYSQQLMGELTLLQKVTEKNRSKLGWNTNHAFVVRISPTKTASQSTPTGTIRSKNLNIGCIHVSAAGWQTSSLRLKKIGKMGL